MILTLVTKILDLQMKLLFTFSFDILLLDFPYLIIILDIKYGGE